MPARLGILLSGSGSTYANLAARCADRRLVAAIAVVVASRPDCGGAALAREHGHPLAIASDPAAVTAALRTAGCDLVAMCGWLRYYDPPADLAGRVLNVHPSLLPAFGGQGMYGLRVHAAVIAHGCRVSGCTVHEVSGAYDSGRILDQAAVRVEPGDTPATLAARVQAAERELYPAVIARRLAGAC